MANIDEGVEKDICDFCKRKFTKNPAKANQECCSPKCRAARWRARKSAEKIGIEKMVANHESRLSILESQVKGLMERQ